MMQSMVLCKTIVLKELNSKGKLWGRAQGGGAAGGAAGGACGLQECAGQDPELPDLPHARQRAPRAPAQGVLPLSP